MMTNSGDEAVKRKEYLDERRILLECRNNAVRSLEKILVALSAGALALSITFLHDIAPHPKQITWIQMKSYIDKIY